MSYPLTASMSTPSTYSTVEIGYPEQADDVREMLRLEGFLARWRPWLTWYDQYFQGIQSLQFMAPALISELGERITHVIINWPRLGAKAFENRLDIDGFTYPGNTVLADELVSVWQANNMQEQSQQVHLESLILSRAYVIVGSGDDEGDPPLTTVESPFQVYAARDPRTRKVSSAVKRWVEDDGTQQAVLYRPNRTVPMTWNGKGWVTGAIDRHDLGRVPVVALVNEPRMLFPDGISEFHDIIQLTDAAIKMATDMMVSGEYHAMPRRWIFGMDPDDFVDVSGNQKSTWSAIAGRLWATKRTKGDDGGQMQTGQFPEANLTVFHDTLKVLSQLVTHTLALPASYMSFTTDNPPSADAIRSAEAPFVKRVERKHTYLGGSWQDVRRFELRIMTGVWDETARLIKTDWRNPATPTVAQVADATMKVHAAGIIPTEQARKDLGYSDIQRREMAEMDERVALDPIAKSLLATLEGSPTPVPVTDAPAGG